jgi:Cof subfamily protein (haloacid dehalogenase superfamily)
MLVIDLDGTLLTSAGNLTRRGRATIQDVHRSGISVVLASARPAAGMRHIVDELTIGTPDVIAYSGALAISSSSAHAPHHRVCDVRIPQEMAEPILERAVELGISCWWYSDDRWYVREPDEISRYEAELTRMMPSRMGDEPLPAPHKLLATGFSDEARRELEVLRDRAEQAGCSPQFSNPHSLEIVAEGVSKGVALRRLTETRGVSLREVVAIGDGPNDRDMLNMAGCAVAMANSAPETLDVADFVTGTNDDDGVADALARLGLDRPPTPRDSHR